MAPNNWNKLIMWGVGRKNESQDTVINYNNLIQGKDNEICNTNESSMNFPDRNCQSLSTYGISNCIEIQGASNICLKCGSGFNLKYHFTRGNRVKTSCTRCLSGQTIKDDECVSCTDESIGGLSQCRECSYSNGKINCESFCDTNYKWDPSNETCILNDKENNSNRKNSIKVIESYLNKIELKVTVKFSQQIKVN